MQSTLDRPVKAHAESNAQVRQHKNTVTVLFANIVDSTSYFERFGDKEGVAMIHRHSELASEVVREYRCTGVNTIGVSVKAEFPDPALAVRAAVEIERRQLVLNGMLPEAQRMQLRIGIHCATGVRRGAGGVKTHHELMAQARAALAEVANLAARIAKCSGPAQILISWPVRDAIQGDGGLKCQWLSKLSLDDRTEEEDVFEVIWTDAASYRELLRKASGTANFPSRYEILGELGAGGTGIVYRARDLETDEVIALKVLKPELASDPTIQESFKNELLLARKITHKNVCRIHEFSRSNGTIYTSMEFIEGESLLSLLNRSGALPLPRALEIARQIGAGLSEAHSQGIVHCDLKPGNVMVDQAGIVKIMDFGVARLAQAGGKATDTIVGTPAYMAPEQAASKPVDGRTDIYALGLVLYEMVTGRPTFDAETPAAVVFKQIRETPKRPGKLVPSLPARIESAIMKCLEKDPADRFQSVDALVAVLERESSTASAPSRGGVFARLRQSAGSIYASLPGRLDPRVTPPAPLPSDAFVPSPAGESSIRSANGSAGAKTPVPTTMESAQAPETEAPVSPSITDDSATLNVTPAPEISSAQGIGSPIDFDSEPPNPPVSSVPPQESTTTEVVAAQAPVNEPATAPAEKAVDSKEDAATSDSSACLYLEVGTYKDGAWADNTVEKLVQLGFPAIKGAAWVQSALKRDLWVKSYRVQVGPYADSKQMEVVEKQLESKGFKPQPAK
jgi:serine/threonine protein kinase/class 3 adenylate cyclase